MCLQICGGRVKKKKKRKKKKEKTFTVSVTAAGFILWHLLDLSRDKLATWKFNRGAAAETKAATALPTITVHREREGADQPSLY